MYTNLPIILDKNTLRCFSFVASIRSTARSKDSPISLGRFRKDSRRVAAPSFVEQHLVLVISDGELYVECKRIDDDAS